MISIIICSRTSDISHALRKNIENTIGVEHEIIVINNEDNRYDIFQAYNIAIAQARYQIICFMHDDILYHTQNWGTCVFKYFQDNSVGMIGISGPTYMGKLPSVWWGIDCGPIKSPNIRQYNIDSNRFNPEERHTTLINPEQASAAEVVACDGLFFCIRKSLFDTIKFDECLQGFHFYDMDISLQIKRMGAKILCVYDILIEHKSYPNLKREWIDASRRFYDKWNYFLPVESVSHSPEEQRSMQTNALNTMLKLISANEISPFKYFHAKEIIYIVRHFPVFIMKKICHRIFNFLK